MARSIKEIKKTMTDRFMADTVIREMYGLSASDSFDATFSQVSLENIIISIVAAACHTLEVIFDLWKQDVEDRVSTSVVATIPWYHRICLEYQHGDSLIVDDDTGYASYETDDDSKKIIKYASCRDQGGGVYILVAKEGDDGYPTALTDDELTSFREYIRRRKPAGVVADIYSYGPDEIRVIARIQYDPIILNKNGTLISDISRRPVVDAINDYLAKIQYGGVFNKTKLIDAIQSAVGVVDVTVGNVAVKPYNSTAFSTVSGNNYQSISGSFKSDLLDLTVTYVLEL